MSKALTRDRYGRLQSIEEIHLTDDMKKAIKMGEPKERICPRCGWVYPALDFQRTTCRFCGKRLATQFCLVCKREYKTEEFYTNLKVPYRCCATCARILLKPKKNINSIEKKKLKVKIMQVMENHYTIMKMKAAKHTKETLTEVRHTLVNYYDGNCAICSNEATNFKLLVKDVDGGKICTANVIPLCDDHSYHFDLDKNPLVALNPVCNKDISIREFKLMCEICGYKQYSFIRREIERHDKCK